MDTVYYLLCLLWILHPFPDPTPWAARSALLSLCFHGYGSVYTRISSRFTVLCRWAPVGTVYYLLRSLAFITFIGDSAAIHRESHIAAPEPPRALFIIYWVYCVLLGLLVKLAFLAIYCVYWPIKDDV